MERKHLTPLDILDIIYTRVRIATSKFFLKVDLHSRKTGFWDRAYQDRLKSEIIQDYEYLSNLLKRRGWYETSARYALEADNAFWLTVRD
ncbi:hypothetical protein FJZ17_03280 [Candidatus Pacearchaeota archaeon]|nr:hypothetical protein [Candidatus Pacearchaeota archaeon]